MTNYPFTVTRETVRLPWSNRHLQIIRPESIDPLLDNAIVDPEQNLPYWAELWPSGIALADLVLSTPGLVAERECLELGCGLGVTAAAAMLSGSQLTVTDYAPEALALCHDNCLANTGRAPLAEQVNWRQQPLTVSRREPHSWGVVLAADVLYERRDIEPLISGVDELLAPDGLLLLAEPGRDVASVFLDRLRDDGWVIHSHSHPGPWPDPKDEGVVVGLHRISRSPKD